MPDKDLEKEDKAFKRKAAISKKRIKKIVSTYPLEFKSTITPLIELGPKGEIGKVIDEKKLREGETPEFTQSKMQKLRSKVQIRLSPRPTRRSLTIGRPLIQTSDILTAPFSFKPQPLKPQPTVQIYTSRPRRKKETEKEVKHAKLALGGALLIASVPFLWLASKALGPLTPYIPPIPPHKTKDSITTVPTTPAGTLPPTTEAGTPSGIVLIGGIEISAVISNLAQIQATTGNIPNCIVSLTNAGVSLIDASDQCYLYAGKVPPGSTNITPVVVGVTGGTTITIVGPVIKDATTGVIIPAGAIGPYDKATADSIILQWINANYVGNTENEIPPGSGKWYLIKGTLQTKTFSGGRG